MNKSLTYSSISSFGRCPRMFLYENCDLITAKGLSPFLEIGTAYHRAMAEHTVNPTPEIAYAAVRAHFAELVEGVPPTQQNQLVQLASWEDQTMATVSFRLVIMEDGFNPCEVSVTDHIATEQVFGYPLSSSGWEYRGRMDGVVNCSDDKFRVLERKTAGRLNNSVLTTLDMDQQSMGYIDGAKHIGHPVVGVLYETVRRPSWKRHANESRPDYVCRCIDNMCKKPGDFYDLRVCDPSEKAIARCRNNTLLILDTIKLALRQPKRFWMNLEHCPRHFNNVCPYMMICREGKGQDILSNYRIKSSQHEELEQ